MKFNFYLGHAITQVRLILRAVPPKGSKPIPGLDRFLAYVQRFDIVPQPSTASSLRGPHPDIVTGMYVLKRSTRSDGTRMGDCIPVTQFRTPIQLLPKFGSEADHRLTKENCLEYSVDFWLNKYHEKNCYYAFSCN